MRPVVLYKTAPIKELLHNDVDGAAVAATDGVERTRMIGLLLRCYACMFPINPALSPKRYRSTFEGFCLDEHSTYRLMCNVKKPNDGHRASN